MENKYYSSQKNDVLFHIFNKNKVCMEGHVKLRLQSL